jgi:hypothetical protein
MTDITLQRLRAATALTPNLDFALDAYGDLLGLALRERSLLEPATAVSWGAAAMIDREQLILSSDEYPDVCFRLIEAELAHDYRPMWSFGWNAFELSVGDVEACHRRIAAASRGYFRILGAPKPLKTYPSIHAMQVQGAGGEVLYLTSDTAAAPAPVPLTRRVGRLFITILGALDIVTARDFYVENFGLPTASIRNASGRTLQNAWGGTASGTQPICLLRLAAAANAIQLDGYIKEGLAPRRVRHGELPPGNALVSFEVESLDGPALTTLVARGFAQPQCLAGYVYGGRRAVTLRGPADELIELIEGTST